MKKEIVKILACGAKNSVIARALNEAGYFFLTYGWDRVIAGVYYEYDNNRCELVEVEPAYLWDCSEDGEIDWNDPRFRNDTTWSVKPCDVPALKWRYGIC